ncbi:MAG: LemA protein [Parcubacteria group bacterium GW2011_GWA2_45_14]|nr:MAG: LemA protein [Parcubacteria group bacterium GW2011_GWA2_45_14]
MSLSYHRSDMSLGTILLVAILAVAGYALMVYNGLIRQRNQVKEAWSDIDVQLKRRYNLIPNLVETVKGYATHEREAFENVTQARARAMGASTPEEQAKAENMLSSTLKSLFAVAEAYPDLKANANFLELQRELSDTENKIQAARRFYNTNVKDYNTAIQQVPKNVIANLFKFKAEEFFEAEEAEKELPKVQFGK